MRKFVDKRNHVLLSLKVRENLKSCASAMYFRSTHQTCDPLIEGNIEEIEFDIVPPTVIKKFATGKGNANKEKMYEAFDVENPGVDIRSWLTPRSTNTISPVSDVVDAYFIVKYGLNSL